MAQRDKAKAVPEGSARQVSLRHNGGEFRQFDQKQIAVMREKYRCPASRGGRKRILSAARLFPLRWMAHR
jgi:hypothetical protein